ncbi:GNAT family N-acetyltransferase [Photobacterium frigidiphilum]|uniref:GNAT family N-acetyltransferase n=1 Tax=Photobacterium frigidiphilum TaxID=264736 RepID=A0A2T3J9M2_9GAMM|nr:GNAT family N-acetyltransferase [Photobacterium frigidiphilum]PSU45526.1 GNAT family N-acetyltransferase [Photobacterium frigidiphilum]
MTKLRFHHLEPLRFPLVNRLYKSYYPAGKAKKDEIIWVGDNEKGIICVVRFKQFENIQLLTGMLVHPEFREQGIAKDLLVATKTQINYKPCYCFAFRELIPLYSNANFHLVDKTELPEILSNRLIRYISSGKDLVAMRYERLT